MVAGGIGVGSDAANEVAGEEPEVLEAAQLLLKLGADVNAVDAWLRCQGLIAVRQKQKPNVSTTFPQIWSHN